MLVASLLIKRAVYGEAVELQHVEAGEPRRRQRGQHLLGDNAQRIVQGVSVFRRSDRDDDDRAGGELGGDIGFWLRQHRTLIEAPAPDGGERIALELFRARGELDLVWMTEIESKLRCGRIAPGRRDL